MKHQVFCIFDSKAGAYLSPFVLPNEMMAKRSFGDCVNDREHAFSLHPEDYTLFSIAVFDDSDASIVSGSGALSIGNGIEFVLRDVTTDQLNLLAESKKTADSFVGPNGDN